MSLDVFDRPATLEKLWDRLVQGVALDALEFGDLGCQADGNAEPVGTYMERVEGMRWQKVESVGLGERLPRKATTAAWRPPWWWTAYRYTSACRCPPSAKKGKRKHVIIHLAIARTSRPCNRRSLRAMSP